MQQVASHKFNNESSHMRIPAISITPIVLGYDASVT